MDGSFNALSKNGGAVNAVAYYIGKWRNSWPSTLYHRYEPSPALYEVTSTRKATTATSVVVARVQRSKSWLQTRETLRRSMIWPLPTRRATACICISRPCSAEIRRVCFKNFANFWDNILQKGTKRWRKVHTTLRVNYWIICNDYKNVMRDLKEKKKKMEEGQGQEFEEG